MLNYGTATLKGAEGNAHEQESNWNLIQKLNLTLLVLSNALYEVLELSAC